MAISLCVRALARLAALAVLCLGVRAWGQITEIEPNDTPAMADASGIVVATTTRISGVVSPGTDVDMFRLNVGLGGVWRFELFDSSGADCIGFASMRMQLLSSAGTVLKTDTGSGIGACPALVVFLDPGVYYVAVAKTTTGASPPYVLECAALTDAGSEIEPNENPPSANPVVGPQVFIFGNRVVAGDVDYYSVTLANFSSVRAEVVEGNGSQACESNLIDSLVTLFNAAGTQLASDDDSGRGFCSIIDGTGSSPVNAGAHNLAPGVYYVRVTASTFSPGQLFAYRLALSISPGTAPTTGACCAASGGCTVTAPGSCGASFLGVGTVCSPNPCPQPTGACCAASGGCAQVVSSSCGGSFLGVGTSCSPNPCPQPSGACCAASGACTITAGAGPCSGTFQGAGTVCAPNPCPIPAGACCSPRTGACAVVEFASCGALDGTFQGGLTACASVVCPTPSGACCTGTSCAAAAPAACSGVGQMFQGVGSACVARVTCCPANFNRDASVGVQDIFDFLAAWFAGCP